MSFFTATFGAGTDVFDIQGVEAGDAAEMETKINNLLAGAGLPDLLADLTLGGAGAGPLWLAELTLADTVGSGVSIAIGSVLVAAAVAGNAAEASLLARQRLAALTPTNVHKVVVAGGGVGPTYMAIAIGS